MSEDKQKKKDIATLLDEFYELELKLTHNQKQLAQLKINEPTVPLSKHYEKAGYSCDLSTSAGRQIAYVNAYKVLVKNDNVKRYGAILNYLAMDEKIAKVAETQAILTKIVRGDATGHDVKILRAGSGVDKTVEIEVKPSMKERISAANILLKSQGAFITKVETIGSGTVQFLVKEATPESIKQEEKENE